MWEYHTLFAVKWNISARLKITLIDAETRAKRIPQHLLDAAPFLSTITPLWGSVSFLFPVSIKVDDYGRYGTILS